MTVITHYIAASPVSVNTSNISGIIWFIIGLILGVILRGKF